MQISEETRRLAIEVIVNLVNIKNQMFEHILKPSGIKAEHFARLKKQKSIDGKPYTKREIGIAILEELSGTIEEEKFIKSIIKIASSWDKFYLADKEYSARGTVQKAREVLNTIEIMEASEAQFLKEKSEIERLRIEELKRHAIKEQKKEVLKQRQLLLMMFDEMATNKNNPQKKGYLLEELTNRLFEIYDIALLQSFRRNSGGEQLDGAFKLDGWHYLVEMKWTSHLSDMSQLDSLYGKVARSGKQTMGVFISVNGWSSNVVPLMKQSPNKTIFLMDGFDLRTVLSGEIDLIDILQKKIAGFNLMAEPFIGVKTLL